MIAQLGDKMIDGNQYYRYYYADLSEDNSLSNISILYSDTNVAHLIDAKKFGRKVPEGYEEAVDNILFSRENILDSKQKGTGYIGKVTKDKQPNQKGIQIVEKVSEISKPIEKQKEFQYPTRVFTRSNETGFIAQRMEDEFEINGVHIIPFDIFEVINRNGILSVKRNSVYTERDFLQDNRPGIANDYLSRDRLDRKVKETGGYIGYYDERGIRTYNGKLVEAFKNIHKWKKSNLTQNPTTTLSQQEVNNRRKWVEQFIDDYKASSIEADGYRFYEENENIQRVVNAIQMGKIDVSGDLNIENNREYLVMGKLARLLIEADNITIDETQDYLGKFINIPEINKLLLKLKKSESVKEMQKRASENRKNGRYPHQYRKTPAEEMRDRRRKQNAPNTPKPVIASDKKSDITPMDIKMTTREIGLEEIKDVSISIRQAQNNPLKENQEEK